MPQLGALLLGVLEQVVGQLVGVGVLEDGARIGEGIEEEEYLERGAYGLMRVRRVRRGNGGGGKGGGGGRGGGGGGAPLYRHEHSRPRATVAVGRDPTKWTRVTLPPCAHARVGL
jgi:hypothetical protein